MEKNVASQKIALYVYDSTTGLPKTGDAANLTFYVNKDWAGVNALADTSATEISSTNAAGWYVCDVSQSETNANELLFTGKSSTANIYVVSQLKSTFPASFGAFITALDAAGTRSALGLATNNLDTQLTNLDTEIDAANVALATIPTAIQNADALLGRNIAGGLSTGRTVSQAFYILRNRWDTSSGTLNVYGIDDTTISWSAPLGTNAAADPIVSSDPT